MSAAVLSISRASRREGSNAGPRHALRRNHPRRTLKQARPGRDRPRPRRARGRWWHRGNLAAAFGRRSWHPAVRSSLSSKTRVRLVPKP